MKFINIQKEYTMSVIRVGLIGLGRAGWGMHTSELEPRKDKFVYTAACDLLPERRERMEKRYPGIRTYADYRELIADPDVDLVCIATRSIDHFIHARDALMAGKTVLAEKPMAVTYEQALELKRISDSGKYGKLYVRHNRRFESNFMYTRGIIDSGILGNVYRIVLARDSFERRSDWQTLSEFGGGLILNWGPHIVDHSLRLLGSEVAGFRSEMKHIAAGGDCEDHLELSFLGTNGRTVEMEISGGMALPQPEYRVYGDRGAMVINGNTAHFRYINPEQKLSPVISDPGTPGAQSFGATQTFASEEVLDWIERDEEITQHGLAVIWDYLYDAIAEGRDFPITLDEAVEVIKYIDLAKQNGIVNAR